MICPNPEKSSWKKNKCRREVTLCENGKKQPLILYVYMNIKKPWDWSDG